MPPDTACLLSANCVLHSVKTQLRACVPALIENAGSSTRLRERRHSAIWWVRVGKSALSGGELSWRC